MVKKSDLNNLKFNPNPSAIMHIDLNSCFATVEQQANPHLRGKPIAVAAYTTPSGCILAPSVEAKRYGLKTGMRVRKGKRLCPGLVVLPADPDKYRSVHLALRKIVSDYTDKFNPKSIDEFVLDLEEYPAFDRGMFKVAREIKQRIRKEVGEWLTVSVGIAPNRFLAKTASGLHKPDGLDEINKDKFGEVYKDLELTDLCGIAERNAAKLSGAGVYTVTDFYEAPLLRLKTAFKSILAYYWYVRLRGWEIDDIEFNRRSFGNSYALPKPYWRIEDLAPILSKLVEKTGTRLRRSGYKTKGISLSLNYRDGGYWNKSEKLSKELFDSRDILKGAMKLLSKSPRRPVRILAVSCFNLSKRDNLQLTFFEDVQSKESLTDSIDRINKTWGDFTIGSAKTAKLKDSVHDRISFGGVKELEELTLNDVNGANTVNRY